MSRRIIMFDDLGNTQYRLSDGRVVTEEVSRPEINGQIVVLIDSSGSMAGNKLMQAKDGAVSFSARAFENNNRVGLVSFDDVARYRAEPTLNLEILRSVVNQLHADGGTDMAAGIALATSILGVKGPRTMVLVSDGVPNSPDLALEEARKAKSYGIDIICIGVDGADLSFLQKIASSEKMAQKVGVENNGLQKAMTASVDLLRLKGK